MKQGEMLAGELEFESSSMRRMLEATPEDRMDWRPHPKSMSLRELTSHIATMMHWGVETLNTEEYVLSDDFKPELASSTTDLVEIFDRNLKELLEQLRAVDDAAMNRIWRLRRQERVILEMPRAMVIRGFILKHLIHHRGQLSVYLRLLDVAVPPSYGPTADYPVPMGG